MATRPPRRNLLGWTVASVREASGVQLVSPIGLSLVALLPFVISLLIPPAAYYDIVHEQNLMFGNIELILFYVGCVFAHIVGCVLVYRPANRIRVAKPGDLKNSAWLMIASPLILAIAVDLLSLTILIINNPRLISLLINGRGAEAKRSLDSVGALSGAQPFITVVVWWSIMRYYTMKRAIKLPSRRKLLILICIAILSSTIVAVIKIARYEIMPLYLGIIVILLRHKGAGRSAWFFLGWGIAAGLFLLFLFGGFALIRGQNPFATFVGYGPAAYNHLAALLNGSLQFPRTGNYTTGFLSNLPLMGRLNGDVISADSAIQFGKEFDLTQAAGLNGSLIWVTAWGYYFVDIGLGVFVFALGLGLLTGWLWKLFDRQNIFGITLYPLFAASIVLWSTSNFLTRPPTTVIVMTSILLCVWELMIDWRRPSNIRTVERLVRGRGISIS